MKKLFITAIILLSGSALFAQTKFGVKAGVNFANVEFKSSGFSVTASSVTSFNVTGFADLGLNESISIQPGIGLSGKGFKIESEGVTMKSDLAYIDIPVNAVAKFPVSGFGKLFLGAGPYASFGILGKNKIEGTDNDMEVDAFGDEGDYKRGDFGANFLAGLELNSGFLVNVNYGLGLANIAKDSGDTTAKNKVFSISVGFLF